MVQYNLPRWEIWYHEQEVQRLVQFCCPLVDNKTSVYERLN